ncbi:helix-turn-helix domain-containing protein [Candidatus Woesearchaeota archaeon]|nr:helix-turn-helix domain-containing protein [Candidatus Woesearchaeota archaeon]
MKALKQFVVKKLREPTEKQLNEDIEWVCSSLGFMTPRDQDKTAFKILMALVNSAKEGKGLTSEELARRVEPTIGSVIYHLKKLMKAGLVVKLESTYELRMKSLLSTIDEIQKDINITLEDIKKVAEDIDDKVGLEHRYALA